MNSYVVVPTECLSDNGLPHTLEHLVFLGSEVLSRTSISIYMNLCMYVSLFLSIPLAFSISLLFVSFSLSLSFSLACARSLSLSFYRASRILQSWMRVCFKMAVVALVFGMPPEFI